MNILHAHTDPNMLTRLREMLRSAARADIAVGYFFVSGFAQAADEISQLRKTRALVGQADRPTLEAVAAGMRQADPLRSRIQSDDLVPRSQRDAVASDAAASVSHGIAAMDQTKAGADAIALLRDLVASGRLEMRSYPRGFMHAKAYLCWHDDNSEQDAVARALAMIEARGGGYIGDVVGLGKTFTGAELLRQLRLSYPNDGPPLIVCPAGLKPMWDRFNERLGLGAEVVSQSVITAPAGAEFDEELGRYIDADPSGKGVVLR